MYTSQKKQKIDVKLTYCDHPNKDVEYFDLRITKIWVQQKIRVMLPQLQHFHNKFNVISCY